MYNNIPIAPLENFDIDEKIFIAKHSRIPDLLKLQNYGSKVQNLEQLQDYKNSPENNIIWTKLAKRYCNERDFEKSLNHINRAILVSNINIFSFRWDVFILLTKMALFI